MKKVMFVDVGELGWSLLLSGHARWLKYHSPDLHIGIMASPDRHCLYRNIADTVYDLPKGFRKKFSRGMESRFGIRGTSPELLRAYFTKNMTNGYELGGFFGRHDKIRMKTIIEPYEYSRKIEGRREILVFPRFRNLGRQSVRNLPMEFYDKAVDALCAKFPDHVIRTMGILSGAYDIKNTKRDNYINSIREEADLQELIDRCQVAVAAVGSQSAPPKLALLQSVPTFMIGHQRERHVKRDNWMSTKVGFHDVQKKHYHNIDIDGCIKEIIAFVGEC